MEVKKKLLRPFAGRFFAGETLADALAHAKDAGAQGMGVTLDFLGEDVADISEAMDARQEYEGIPAAVSVDGLDCSLAVKLTHLGLELDKELAYSALKSVASACDSYGVRLWLDMEGSAHTDDTIEAYRMIRGLHPDTGIALQASLWRTWEDMTALVAGGALIRLVKGAYRELSDIAATRPAEIHGRFTDMMMYLFANSNGFAIGTHDLKIIDAAKAVIKDLNTEFEFQMLMGMRDGLKRTLVEEGNRVVEYVPYGEDWYGYGMRRLMEQRRNLVRFAEGLAGR